MSNYKTLIVSSIKYMADKYPDMTFSEILYSILRKENLKSRPNNVNNSWILSIDDSDIYEAVENAIKVENE